MIEGFKYKGEFYLPHDKKNTVRGTLIFKPKKGIELDLIGSFGRNHSDKQEIIWGILENGKSVTLYNSYITSKQFSSPGFAIDKYVSIFVFFDIYFNNKNDIKFSKVSTHYSHLDEWLNIRSGFKIDNDSKNYKVKIEYELPSPINVSLPNNLELTINLTAKGPSINLVQKDALIKQKAFINFVTPRKRNFDMILQEIFHFQNFLTLVTQRSIYTKELYGYLRIGNKKQLYKSRIIFKVYNIPKNEKELFPMDMLIPFVNFSNSFNTIITNWFSFKNQLETAIDPFFSTYYNPNLYISDKFLNLIRSMEAFHRDNIRNRATNRDRFLTVLKELSSVYNWLLKIKSKPKYVGNILKHRNDLTHSNPVIRSKDKRYLELHYISEQLTIIMSCVLLHKIGFSKKDLKKYLDETRLYTHIKYKMK